jgi:transposase-like protein
MSIAMITPMLDYQQVKNLYEASADRKTEYDLSRSTYSVEFKLKAISRIEKLGMTKAARMSGISRGTLEHFVRQKKDGAI